MDLGVALVMAVILKMMIWKALVTQVTLGMELVPDLEERDSSLGHLTMTWTTISILWVQMEEWTGTGQEIIPVVVRLQMQDRKYPLHALSHRTSFLLLLCGLVEYSLIGCDEPPFCFINIT